ncbi:hypothetical protein RM52_01700 [Microbacterium hominis]|uniref:Uncharacterized protein n=2 Tax=Microbacterium hominis TaxID=162426 RepID=A0A0B4E0Q6_9MICO|nr:hypothetical protein RM52_01700 [Microbacterium hominis]
MVSAEQRRESEKTGEVHGWNEWPMRAERGLENPVVFGVVIHAVVFVALLASLSLMARSLDQSIVIVVVAAVVPATIIILVSFGFWAAAVKERTRHRLVVSHNPGATVVPVEWSTAVLAPFVKETGVSSSDDRGFALEIAVDGSGMSFWRSRTTNDVISIGRLDWSQIDSVEAGGVKAVIGPRVAPTVKITLRPGAESPFADEIELLVRKVPVEHAVAALQPPMP